MMKKSKLNRGFTLIELMTAVSIFVVVMTISMGAILNIFDANRKARTLKTVLNNLNLVVERIRFFHSLQAMEFRLPIGSLTPGLKSSLVQEILFPSLLLK